MDFRYFRGNTYFLRICWNAQIHFFRGASFFRIAHAYGTGPIPLDPAETEDQFNVAAETAENLYAQAIQDLTVAKADLPSEQEEVGRPTKGAATAFLGKLYLYRAGYLNDDSSYGLAASEFEEIITIPPCFFATNDLTPSVTASAPKKLILATIEGGEICGPTPAQGIKPSSPSGAAATIPSTAV